MKAEQMFYELGYKKSTDIDAIAYSEKLDGTFHCFEITFDLTEKVVELYDDYEGYTINKALLKAIDKQVEELGWLDEKTCENLSEYNLCDRFECSNCGIVLGDYQEIVKDEDDGYEYSYEYIPKYCPNCGRKIID